MHHPRALAASLLAAALTTLGGAAACRPALDGLGPTDADRARNSTQLFTALADRFNASHRSPHYAVARAKIAKAWLVPSKVWADTGVWLARTDSTATFTAFGRFLPFGYVMQERASLPPIVALADARHQIMLRRTPEKEWEWTAGVDFGIGTVKADEMARLFSLLLTIGDGHSDAQLKGELHKAIPLTAAAAGKLWDLDSLRALPLADGSSAMLLESTIHPERIAATLPAFSAFVRTYLLNAAWRLTLRDRQGVVWFYLDGARGRTELRWRVHKGELLPFEGPPRPMPDDMTLEIEFKAKVGMFTIGLSNFITEFTFVHTPTERGWNVRMNHPPKWHLPLGVARLIDASLKRPFQGDGASWRIVFKDSANAPTTISRQTHGFVRESAVIRFLGSLSGTVAGDFNGGSEKEEAIFLADLFGAMRKDAALQYGGR